MKGSTIFAALSFLASAFAAPAPLESRQNGRIITTGVKNQGVQPRLEIRQMAANKPNQFTLLILGMEKFHAMQQNDPSSYYQIAGIHGVPSQDWNGASQCSDCDGADGYCPHDMCIFPCWHRAYMAQFEQSFMSVVNGIANAWPSSGRAAMQSAAKQMRFVYWDWAAAPPQGTPDFPNLISSPTITINAQNGKRTLKNPLYRHYFPDPSQLKYDPFNNWQFTMRYPSDNGKYAHSTEDSLVQSWANVRTSLRDQLYDVFTKCKTYQYFSNDAADSTNVGCSNSLEGVHNLVHTMTGGGGWTDSNGNDISGGHMTYLSLAAFDPLFFMHHMNVDRILAMWQTLYPTQPKCQQQVPHSTWVLAQGSDLSTETPLLPFFKDSNTPWVCSDMWDWTKLGYTYSEFVNSDGKAASIKSYINKLYGPQASATAGSSKRGMLDNVMGDVENTVDNVMGDVTNAVGQLTNAVGEILLTPFQAQNGSSFQYFLNVETPRYVLNGSYYIYAFKDGPASEDSRTWLADSNLMGPMGVIAQPGKDMHNVMITGQIPLTTFLSKMQQQNELPDLSEATAVPWLSQHLQWRIAGPKGQEVSPNDLPGFQASVYASSTSPLKDLLSLPEWSDNIPLPVVTENKDGGASCNSTSYRRI